MRKDTIKVMEGEMIEVRLARFKKSENEDRSRNCYVYARMQLYRRIFKMWKERRGIEVRLARFKTS